MVEIIIVSHGNYAVEILNSVEMVYGKVENLKAVTINDGESLKELENKLKFEVENSRLSEFLILVDLLGGTPYNSTQGLIHKENVEVITGVNIPMILKVLPITNKPLKEVAFMAEEAGKLGIVNVSNIFKNFRENKMEKDSNENNI